ncbi:diadenylate cyclase [Salsuginibacillus halophilus]|uniref:DNA integrity scanning protein DisA n=1 Tax=Salsuginibacillus halophilus TaxID=517424 RepID=A0A2P8H502_9BACI|nr:DNA integrity scanning diadenylate cyclase DisA [Salsuginibacillus halophilus]PSL41297.1 diadenylate cyclase [Salsuginibacillus halophilus]
MNREKDAFIEEVLKLVAPGTPLRDGLDNVLRANTGGLIVLGHTEELKDIVDGGFDIHCEFTPANLYELAKMDGAIILSEDASRILYANTQLVPNNAIPSSETGIRHRTAQRVAKQTGSVVVSISQRRHIITLYQGEHRYALKDMGVILTKANQAIQTLEKYKVVLDQSLTNLGALEFEELVSLQDVAQVMHRIEMVLRIKQEIRRYVQELGVEGRLVTMQLNELVADMEQEAQLLVKDYVKDLKKADAIVKNLQQLSSAELMDDQMIMKQLGYQRPKELQEHTITPRGYRILYRVPRLPSSVVHNLVSAFGGLSEIAAATPEMLNEVDGVGEARARAIKEGINRIQEQLFIDRNV